MMILADDDSESSCFFEEELNVWKINDGREEKEVGQ